MALTSTFVDQSGALKVSFHPSALESAASGQSVQFDGADVFSELCFDIAVTTISGGTLAIWLQRLLPSGNWDDLASTSFVATGEKTIDLTNAGSQINTVTNATLAAGTVKMVNFLHSHRLSWTISGGNTATFAIVGVYQ